MVFPTLSNARIAGIANKVSDYIKTQREKYASRTAALDRNQKALLGRFFPSAIVNSAAILVLDGERVENPHFYPELVRRGFPEESLPSFSTMRAITFIDTVVSHEAFTDRLLFHELVHVVQYQKLGLAEFAAKYVNGFLKGGSYWNIPLEVNAHELDARFSTAPEKAFSVEDEVQAWIDRGLF